MSQVSTATPGVQLVLNTKSRPTFLRPVISVGDGPGSFELDAESLARVERFRHRTALTFASPRMHNILQHDVISIAVKVSRIELALCDD